MKTISSQIATSNKTESELAISDGVDTYGLKIGDKKVDNGLTYYIAGFNHDVVNSETGITFVVNSDVNSHAMNSSSKTYKGNSSYNAGGYVNSDLYSHVSLNRWLLSYQEVGFSGSSYVKVEGTQYPLFSSKANRKMVGIKPGASSSSDWWLRSSFAIGSNYFYYVNIDGNSNDINASNSYGIVLGFCI